MSSFAYIQPKNSLAKDVENHRLVAKIIEKIGEIPKHQEYKHNLELLKMICVMVEHAIDNKGRKVKVDKKDVVFQCITRLWSNTSPQELKAIEANIEFLWENGFIIKKSRWSVIKHSVCEWFQRKILN